MYVIELLPKMFQEQKKSLLLQLKEAKVKNQRQRGESLRDHIVFFVENEKNSPFPFHSDKESNESSDSEICSQSNSTSLS